MKPLRKTFLASAGWAWLHPACSVTTRLLGWAWLYPTYSATTELLGCWVGFGFTQPTRLLLGYYSATRRVHPTYYSWVKLLEIYFFQPTMSNAQFPMPGTLYGIGIGPGDPELITLKGLRLLKTASVVAFPEGVGGKIGVAQQIVAQWLKPEQAQLPLTFPYVRDEEILTRAWQVAAERVWQYLRRGQDAVFVCEGDVNFYSSFTYLAQTLQQWHPEAVAETVPGICSPMAAVAALGIPLTIREQRLAVLPALYNLKELESVLNWADVVVLMKVSSTYKRVWEILRHRHLLDNTYVVEWASLPTQKIYRGLRDRPSLQLSYFSLAIVRVAEAT